jgi:hypothetical protein
VGKINVIALGKSLHQFKTHPAAGQLVIGIGIIRTLSVEYGYSIGQLFIWYMVVADDKINPFLFGVTDFFDRFDAAIKGYYEGVLVLGCIVYSLVRNTIPFVVAIGNIIVDVRGKPLQEFIDQCNGCSSSNRNRRKKGILFVQAPC